MKNKKLFLLIPEEESAEVTCDGFCKAVAERKEQFKTQSTILLQTNEVLCLYASIMAAKELEISLYLYPIYFDRNKMANLAQQWNAAIYLDGSCLQPAKQSEKQKPYLGIFTSGTTGAPKMALLSWEAVEHSAKFASKNLKHQTWLLSYSLWSYAGLQVFFAAWHSKGTIYYRAKPMVEVCKEVVKYDVSVISATPTYWKLLIGTWPQALKPPRLMQATIGGEIVDQPVIDLIEKFFQPQHLTHIYASTEAGTAIVVSDRMAGFPAAYLQKRSSHGLELRIKGDELQIRSPVSANSYIEAPFPKDQEGWIQTGDLVQIKNERVYFLGRKDGRLNVGGRKVCPEEIEQALNFLDGIEDSLVYGKKSSLMGTLVAADVVMKNSSDFNVSDIKKRLRLRLEDYKIPQIIRRVDHIAISSSRKKSR